MDKFKTLSVVVGLFLCTARSWGQEITVNAIKAGAVYASGEKIVWHIGVQGEGAADIHKVAYVLKKGGLTEMGRGELTLQENGADLETKLDEPGAVLAEFSASLPDKPEIKAKAGALVDPDKIAPSSPRPADFDAFWKSKIEELKAVPANPVLEPSKSGLPNVDYWKITLDNIRGTKIQGQLARPKAEGKKLPALLMVQYAGVYPLSKYWAIGRANQGWLTLNISAHDLPIDSPAEFYKEQSETVLKNYPAIGSDDRETSYFLRMYLSCYRAVDYLASRDDWDGKTIVVMGASQGGLQALMTAGLHPKVTAAIANVPAGADQSGPLIGRQPGWPVWHWQVKGKDRAKVAETSRYYDTVNFASGIKCPTLIAAGLIDTTCPPAGVVAAFNQIHAPKELLIMEKADHKDVNKSQALFNQRSEEWLKDLLAGNSPLNTSSVTRPATPGAPPKTTLTTTPTAQSATPSTPDAPTTISAAETVTGWKTVTLIDDAKVGAHAVRVAVPAGKTGGATLSLRAANVDFSKGGTIRFWYRLSGTGRTDLMLRVVTPTFADNFQTVFPVLPAQQADGQWHQAVIDLASPYQKWSTAPETGSNYLNFRTSGAADSNLTLDLDDVTFTPPGNAPTSTPSGTSTSTPAMTKPVAGSPGLGPPDPARVKEIASYLDPVPRGPGLTLDNRAAWDALGAAPVFKTAISPKAEKFLDQPIPEVSEEAYDEAARAGSRDLDANIDMRRGRLVHFVLAEGVENKGRFLPAIEKELAAICSEKSWILPPHVRSGAKNDLGSAMTSWTLATAVSILGDRLSAATRKMVKDAVHEKVLQPFLVQVRDMNAKSDFWRKSPFNWNAVVHAGITGAALALDDSIQERAEIIAATEKETQLYINGFPSDGYSTEGMGYWKYGFGHYILLAEAVLSATHGMVNLYNNGTARLVAQFPRRFEVASEIYPAYSDSRFKDAPSRWLYYILDQRYNLGDMAPRTLALDPTFTANLYAHAINLAFDPKAITPAKNADVVQGHRIRDWFEQSQVYVGRPNTADSGLALSFKGGTNSNAHGHNDLGSFVVVKNKTPMLVDPGSTVYTAATFGPERYSNQVINSYGHSVPRVARELQRQGEKYFATVATTRFSDASDRITLDLTQGYEVPALKKLTRIFEYSRAGAEIVTITDHVEYSSPQAFGTALVTFGEAKEEKAGTWLITQGDQSVRVVIDTDGVRFTVTNEVLKDEAAAGKVRRLGIDLNNPTAQTTITISITAA